MDILRMCVSIAMIIVSCQALSLVPSPESTCDPCKCRKCGFNEVCVADKKSCSSVCTEKCPKSIPVQCLIAPCSFNNCKKDELCVPGCQPCSSVCLKKKRYINPCLFTKCGFGQKCVVDGCNSKCVGEIKCTFICPKILKPVCGSDGKTYNNVCLLKLACCLSGRKITKKSNGRCPKQCPEICPLVHKPVCGSDGKTYSNSCFLGVASCKSGNKITQVGDGPCPAILLPQCFSVLSKPNQGSELKPSVPQICGQAFTLFCTNDCKFCCMSPNTCAPHGFPRLGSTCGMKGSTTI